MESTAYRQGRLAAQSGNGIHCNPYSIDAKGGNDGNAFDQWTAGWLSVKYGSGR
jgi:hypothetical protein